MSSMPPVANPGRPIVFEEQLVADGADELAYDLTPFLDDALLTAELCERSLREYVRTMWPIVEPAVPFVGGWHTDAICDHLEAATRGQIRNLLITIPPRHGKSTVISVMWPTWVWTLPETADCLGRPALGATRKWLFAAYADRLAIRDAVRSRRVMASPLYQNLWGDRFKMTGDQNEKTRYENNRTGYRLVTSVGSSATGDGGDFIAVDDPHSVRDVESERIREETTIWWDETMSSRYTDARTVVRVIIMQRLHEKDLAGHVLEKGGWTHLCLPTEYEVEEARKRGPTILGWTDPRTAEGELLDPVRFGPEQVRQAKLDLGGRVIEPMVGMPVPEGQPEVTIPYAYAAQHQQRPVPRGGGMLQRAWWRYYDPMSLEELGRLETVIQSWDMAFKDEATSSYVVGQVWGVRLAKYYLLDQVRAQMDFPTTIKAVRMLAAKWPMARQKYVEDKANGPAVVQTLMGEVSGLLAVPPEGSKEARAASVSWLVEAGNVYLPDPRLVPWVEAFLAEAASFPRGATDDQVDAFSQALIYLTVKRAPGLMIYSA